MSLLDTIRDRAETRGEMHVPEWDQVVFWRPWTVGDARAIRKYTKDDDPAGFAAVVTRKAEDGDGNRLFADEDRIALQAHAELAVLRKLAAAMMDSVSVSDAAGN